jgi:hypothetical protein
LQLAANIYHGIFNPMIACNRLKPGIANLACIFDNRPISVQVYSYVVAASAAGWTDHIL